MEENIINIENFERVEVVEDKGGDFDREYGYITIKNKNGETGTYYKNRLMPEAEFYANKYNL
jgi:hypothetical protein